MATAGLGRTESCKVSGQPILHVSTEHNRFMAHVMPPCRAIRPSRCWQHATDNFLSAERGHCRPLPCMNFRDEDDVGHSVSARLTLCRYVWYMY